MSFVLNPKWRFNISKCNKVHAKNNPQPIGWLFIRTGMEIPKINFKEINFKETFEILQTFTMRCSEWKHLDISWITAWKTTYCKWMSKIFFTINWWLNYSVQLTYLLEKSHNFLLFRFVVVFLTSSLQTILFYYAVTL